MDADVPVKYPIGIDIPDVLPDDASEAVTVVKRDAAYWLYVVLLNLPAYVGAVVNW